MAITHDSFTVPVTYHGNPVWGPWRRPTSIKTWWGIKGALTLVGMNQTCECGVEATMTGYATRLLLETAQETMDAQLDLALKGTLTIDSVTYAKCLFLGWEATSPAFLDGSGQHGWTQMGRLKWLRTR